MDPFGLRPAERSLREEIGYVFAADPTTAGGGSERRARRLVEELSSLGWPITLVEVPVPIGAERRRAQLAAAVCGVPPAFGRAGRDAALLGWGGKGAPSAPRIIIVGGLFSVSLVPRRLWGGMLLDAHNVESEGLEQAGRSRWVGAHRAAFYRATSGWAHYFERRVARASLGVWAVSEADRQWFEAAGAPTTALVPNCADLPVCPPGPNGAPNLVFVGSLRAGFNREGVSWFLTKVWPRVLTKVPGATLTLVGGGGDDFSGPGVHATGYVDDVSPHLAAARAAVVPLISGAGTRLKVSEAMAWALPCVSTTVGAAGLGLAEGDGVTYGDNESSFALACIRLLENREIAVELGQRGRQIVESRLSWGYAAAAADRHLTAMIASGNDSPHESPLTGSGQ